MARAPSLFVVKEKVRAKGMEEGKCGRAEQEFLEANQFALGMNRSLLWNAEWVFWRGVYSADFEITMWFRNSLQYIGGFPVLVATV